MTDEKRTDIVKKSKPFTDLKSKTKEITSLVEKLQNIDSNLEQFEISMHIAYYLKQIKDRIPSEMMNLFKNLMNTGIGFKTDKDYYSDEIIKDCMIQAMMHGLRLYGNEFNILAGNFYATKEGLERVIKTYPSLSKEPIIELRSLVQDPKSKNWKFSFKYELCYKNGTTSSNEYSCIIRGLKQGKNGTYPIAYEAVEGKAYRKCYKEIYNKLNRNFRIKDSDDVDDLKIIQEDTNSESKLKKLVET